VSETPRELILASASPRRQDLLREAGFDFRVVPSEIPETARLGESPADRARRLAAEKARAVCDRIKGGGCFLAADTLVVDEVGMLGKPHDAEEAQSMLLRLAGRTHRVLTGYALAVPEVGHLEIGLVESRVHMRAVGADEALAYALTAEPYDKAGGYAVQGQGGRFVASVEGSLSNVIGLPLEEVVPRLESLGVARRKPAVRAAPTRGTGTP
jgi:septum formation protein